MSSKLERATSKRHLAFLIFPKYLVIHIQMRWQDTNRHWQLVALISINVDAELCVIVSQLNCNFLKGTILDIIAFFSIARNQIRHRNQGVQEIFVLNIQEMEQAVINSGFRENALETSD